jgi:hypothetical protein
MSDYSVTDIFLALAEIVEGGKLKRLPKSLKWEDLDKECAELILAEFPYGYAGDQFTLKGLMCDERTFILCNFDDDDADYHLSCLATKRPTWDLKKNKADWEWEILHFQEN